MVFGIRFTRINFAHGDVYMLGAFIGMYTAHAFGFGETSLRSSTDSDDCDCDGDLCRHWVLDREYLPTVLCVVLLESMF